MGRNRYRVWESEFPHFVTCTIVKWTPLFMEPEIVGILLAALRHLQAESGLRVHGYVIMEHHLHLVVSGEDWPKSLARFKSFTAGRIVRWLKERGRDDWLRALSLGAGAEDGRQHQVWQAGVHPQKIAGTSMLEQKLSYMHANPLRRRYVDEPTAWRNSSARNYAGMPGVLEVEKLT